MLHLFRPRPKVTPAALRKSYRGLTVTELERHYRARVRDYGPTDPAAIIAGKELAKRQGYRGA